MRASVFVLVYLLAACASLAAPIPEREFDIRGLFRSKSTGSIGLVTSRSAPQNSPHSKYLPAPARPEAALETGAKAAPPNVGAKPQGAVKNLAAQNNAEKPHPASPPPRSPATGTPEGGSAAHSPPPQLTPGRGNPVAGVGASNAQSRQSTQVHADAMAAAKENQAPPADKPKNGANAIPPPTAPTAEGKGKGKEKATGEEHNPAGGNKMPKVQQEGNGGGSPPSPGSQGHTDQGAADPDQAEKQRKAKHEDDTLEVQRNTLNETKAKNKSDRHSQNIGHGIAATQMMGNLVLGSVNAASLWQNAHKPAAAPQQPVQQPQRDNNNVNSVDEGAANNGTVPDDGSGQNQMPPQRRRYIDLYYTA